MIYKLFLREEAIIRGNSQKEEGRIRRQAHLSIQKEDHLLRSDS